MFFSDGQDGTAGLNDFLSDFGSDDSPSRDSQIPEPDSQGDASLTDSSTPQDADDGQEFSAEEFVADQIAADLADEGYEVSDSEEDDVEEADDDTVALEKLSPDELKAYAKELLDLKVKQAEDDDQAQLATVQAKVVEVEQAAMAEVERAFQREVLADSEQHYNAELRSRISGIVRAAKNQDDPDTYITHNAIAAAFTVFEAKQAYERKKAQEWDQVAQKARLTARQNDPAVREYVARRLVKTLGLPEEAVRDIADPNRHILAFEHRANELLSIAASLGTERKKQAQTKRHAANTELKRNPTRTSSTGRQPGGKPRDMKDLDDQKRREVGAVILQQFRQ